MKLKIRPKKLPNETPISFIKIYIYILRLSFINKLLQLARMLEKKLRQLRFPNYSPMICPHENLKTMHSSASKTTAGWKSSFCFLTKNNGWESYVRTVSFPCFNIIGEIFNTIQCEMWRCKTSNQKWKMLKT